MLLQSLNEDAISFIVIPFDANSSPLDGTDLEEACEASGVSRDSATLLFIVTIRPKAGGDGVEMSVNLRAPIVFDLRARRARRASVCWTPHGRSDHALGKSAGEVQDPGRGSGGGFS